MDKVYFPLLVILLSGCDKGTLTLSIADAPIDGATQVVVKFTGVDVLDTDGKTHSFTLSPVVAPNLLSTSGQSTLLLSKVTLPVGDYKSIKFQVSAGTTGQDSHINLNDGSVHALELLDRNASGLIVPVAFHVTRQQDTALTVDFDLRKSVLNPDASTADPSYLLKPAIRIVENDLEGALTGTASATLLSASDCSGTVQVAAVYVYSGSGVTPDDVGGTGAQPVTSAIIPASTLRFTAAFLNPGTYTAWLTCEASRDDPIVDDGITFLQKQEFTVTAGETATITFQ